MSRSAPAASARSSADLFPQSPGSPSLGGGDAPSREEVQQRISSLYDRAETATGNYNATRAMLSGSRGRPNPARDNGRRNTETTLDDVSRPWLDVARAQLGPSAPARLPADRMPKRRAEALPAPVSKPLESGSSARALEASGRPVPELTAGPGAGPRAEQAALPAAGPAAELPAGRAVAALPAGTGARREAVGALPAPAVESPHSSSSLKSRKERNRRKLALARDLLARHAVQRRTTPVAAIEAPPARQTWPSAEELVRREAEEPWRGPVSAGAALGARWDTAARPDTGDLLGGDASLDAGTPLYSAMMSSSGLTFAPDPASTGSVPGAVFATGVPSAGGTAFASDTGSLPGVAAGPGAAFGSDTGSLPSVAAGPGTGFASDTGSVPGAVFAPGAPSAGGTGFTSDTGSLPGVAAGPGAAFGSDTGSLPGVAASPGAGFASDTASVPGMAFVPDTTFTPGMTFASDTAFAPGTSHAPELSYAQDVAWAPDRLVAPDPLTTPDPPFAAEPPRTPAGSHTGHIPAVTVAPDASFAPGASVGAGMPGIAGMAVGGDTAGSGYDVKAAKALDFARAQIGRPCVWGAAGPGSYDCAGLTRAAWMVAGVALPRTAGDQAAATAPVPLTDLRAGDLIFFYGDVSHVGLYIGDSMMIHAPSPGAYIREESIFYAGQAAIHSAARPV
ncbi:NlpC/P60 family protein [Streptomyces sp. NPDC058108]|uniref:NlpC/P60 family protein n=1 Tax=Streptomyces sp. NPDC058108 TaxID=3346344 RepID=UPI0036F0F3CB